MKHRSETGSAHLDSTELLKAFQSTKQGKIEQRERDSGQNVDQCNEPKCGSEQILGDVIDLQEKTLGYKG